MNQIFKATFLCATILKWTVDFESVNACLVHGGRAASSPGVIQYLLSSVQSSMSALCLPGEPQLTCEMSSIRPISQPDNTKDSFLLTSLALQTLQPK